MDSLIATYFLTIDNYKTYYGLFYWHLVTFKSDSNYNILPMTNLFNAIPGVFVSEQVGSCCDGNNIWDSIYSDHVELIYSVGWGDCPSGCTERRFWKFNVYHECSVEFVGSYGNPLPIVGMNTINKKSISVKPNPFIEFISIDGIDNRFNYSITNSFGQILLKGQSTNNILDNFNGLTCGIYFLTIHTDNQTATFKIQKK